jgi:hypothetical protein
VVAGDWIQADFDDERKCLLFTKEAEGLELHTIASMVGGNLHLHDAAMAAAAAQPEHTRTIAKPAKK